MRYAFVLLICAVVALAASPAYAHKAPPTPAPTETPVGTPDSPVLPSPKPATEDPKITKVAVREFLAWQTGTVDRSHYSDQMNANISDELLTKSAAGLAHLGALQKTTFEGISIAGPTNQTFYTYTMACADGSVRMQFGLDQQGKISLLYFL